MSTFLLSAILTAVGTVSVVSLIGAIGVASFVLVSGPLAYRLVITALLCFGVFSQIALVVFRSLGVIDEGSQIITALALAFALVGTLVGAYFGTLASDKTQGAIERANETANRALAEMDHEASERVQRVTSRTAV
jgi:hypothetical protein